MMTAIQITQTDRQTNRQILRQVSRRHDVNLHCKATSVPSTLLGRQQTKRQQSGDEQQTDTVADTLAEMKSCYSLQLANQYTNKEPDNKCKKYKIFNFHKVI